jgi:hypothetical protein
MRAVVHVRGPVPGLKFPIATGSGSRSQQAIWLEI